MISVWRLSIGRACAAAWLSRKAWYLGDKRERVDKRDAPMIEALSELVAKHNRWGFWMCYHRLKFLGKE